MEFDISSADPISEVARWPWEKLVFYAECLSEATPDQPASAGEMPSMDDVDVPSMEDLPPEYRP